MANLFQSVLRLNGTAVADTYAASHAHFQRYLAGFIIQQIILIHRTAWGDRRRIPGPPHQDKKVINRLFCL